MTAPKKPAKVLYVENGIGYGGAAICMRHLVRHVDRSRYYPIVVTGRTGSQYEEIASEAQWHHIRDRHIDIVSWRKRVATHALLRQPILRFIIDQILARLDDVVNLLPFLAALIRLARRERIDLIHANNEPLCNRAALLAGRILGIPVICHVRGDQTGSRIMQHLYQLPDHFISVSHWIDAGVARMGVAAHKRSVIYDGIALENLDIHASGDAFRQAHNIPVNAFVVGLVGLLIPWKGQELFLDAAHHLRHNIPNLRLLLVGGTPDDYHDFETHLRARIESEGLGEIIAFTGHVDNMCAAYNALDIVVSASTLPEPLGTVVIEALALGRPLVVPNHGGGAEMTEHERTALVFTPGSSTSLAEAILRLYREPELGARLGAAARNHALAVFDVHTHAKQVQAVYDQILERKTKSRLSS